jgi:pyrimidine operon attenuation protein/uracil phosphoribosyltransferase
MPEKVIMTEDEIRRALVRISHEVLESNGGCNNLVLIGVHTRGVPLAHRIAAVMKGAEKVDVPVGNLDIGLHRDDLQYLETPPVIRPTDIPTSITGKNVVLVDDVLFTGRSIRAAMDALIDFGRPQRIQLAVLIDRGHRELPIRANFVGRNIPSSKDERVQLRLKEIDGKDEVVIINNMAKQGAMQAQ